MLLNILSHPTDKPVALKYERKRNLTKGNIKLTTTN